MWEWRVRESRPRIWLDEARLAWLREKVKGRSLEEIRALAGKYSLGYALTYLLTGDEESGRTAISTTLASSEQAKWIYVLTPAVCYDWCYPVLTATEKALLRERFIRKGHTRLSHHRAWHSFHHFLYTWGSDLGVSAIALGPDDPFAGEALSFLKSRYKDAMRVFEDVFPDGEWPEGFNLARSVTMFALRFLWALKTATGDDLMAQSRHLRNSSLYTIYLSKPNGLVYPGGDNDYPYLKERDREVLLMLASQFRDPYAQYFLNHCKAKTFQANRDSLWQDLLWHDPAIPERSLDDLPRSRVFRGNGLVTARSGWGWDDGEKTSAASWVTFRCGAFFGQATHYDNNHFEVYYKGELAIDSGRDDPDSDIDLSSARIPKSQYYNYYRRSIAHNTILAYDGDEVMAMGVANDGGQKEMLRVDGTRNEPENYDLEEYSLEENRMCYNWARHRERWDTGRMVAYCGNNLFTYACGDATKSYSEEKIESFARQFLYIQPDVVVVFDRVVCTTVVPRKIWLLHSIIEPRVHGDGPFELRYNGGRLVCIPVLPEHRTIEKIGGPGKEFLVDGVHYACGPRASSGHRSPLNFGELPGAWRIELSPAMPAEEDCFLNVMLLTDKGSKALPEVTRDDSDSDSFALEIGLPFQRRVKVAFARGPKPGARLLIEARGKALFDGAMPEGVVLEKGRL